MKKITMISAVLVAIVLMSFSGTSTKTIARSFYESYANDNMDKAFDDYIASDVVNHTMGAVASTGRNGWLTKSLIFRPCQVLKSPYWNKWPKAIK